MLRIALKGLAELCEDEDQFINFLEGSKRLENMLKGVAQIIVDSCVSFGSCQEFSINAYAD